LRRWAQNQKVKAVQQRPVKDAKEGPQFDPLLPPWQVTITSVNSSSDNSLNKMLHSSCSLTSKWIRNSQRFRRFEIGSVAF
jgi:hypothetical protein